MLNIGSINCETTFDDVDDVNFATIQLRLTNCMIDQPFKDEKDSISFEIEAIFRNLPQSCNLCGPVPTRELLKFKWHY
jgi:hypothetical protein